MNLQQFTTHNNSSTKIPFKNNVKFLLFSGAAVYIIMLFYNMV